VSKGTHVIIPLVDSLEDERWEAKIVERNGNRIKLSVNSPAGAVIGLYGLSVTTSSSKGEAATTHDSSKNIVMLFNPWCEGKIGSGCEQGGGAEGLHTSRAGMWQRGRKEDKSPPIRGEQMLEEIADAAA